MMEKTGIFDRLSGVVGCRLTLSRSAAALLNTTRNKKTDKNDDYCLGRRATTTRWLANESMSHVRNCSIAGIPTQRDSRI